MVGSGVKRTSVPSGASPSLPCLSDLSLPRSKLARRNLPSRNEATSNADDSAFTALVPTPFRPTENWNTSSLYLPPVLICETHSTTLPSGMPRPKSRTLTVSPSRSISIFLPWPMMNSSTELSTTSLSITYTPSAGCVPSPMRPMYMPVRRRMCSRASSVWIVLSS